jgi:hypothetical protein
MFGPDRNIQHAWHKVLLVRKQQKQQQQQQQQQQAVPLNPLPTLRSG